MPEAAGEMVTFMSDSTEATGYLVRPAGDGPFPALVVIQEWWGLNQNIKDIAHRFADAGFLALAPDLYHGEVASEPDEAQKLVMALNMGGAVREIMAAVNYLCGRSDVSKIGLVGFCMGGSLGMYVAAHTPRLNAMVSFYGGRHIEDEDLRQIGCPILAIYAGNDEVFPLSVREHNRELWTTAGVPHEIVVYENTEHGFFNDRRSEEYNAAAASDSWQRTLAFFRTHLQSA